MNFKESFQLIFIIIFSPSKKAIPIAICFIITSQQEPFKSFTCIGLPVLSAELLHAPAPEEVHP